MAALARRVHHDGMNDGSSADGAGAGEPTPDSAAIRPSEPSGPLWLSPSVVAAAALRSPGPAVSARQQARRDAGLDEDGLGYPRSQLWILAVLPAAVITVLCLVLLVVTQAAVWGLAGAAAAAIGGVSAGYLRRDPLRISSAERRELVADRSWHSVQPWTGGLADTPERRLVAQAQDAVKSLVAAPAWSGRAFEEHRLRLDLQAELDEVDRQAYQLASTSPGGGAPRPPRPVGAPAPPKPEPLGPQNAPGAPSAHDSARQALRRRVDALSAYADAVAALPPTAPPSAIETDADDRVHRALTAAVRDEFGTEQWTRLRHELPTERNERSV